MRNPLRLFLVLACLSWGFTPAHGADDNNNADEDNITIQNSNTVVADDTLPIGKRAARDFDPYAKYYKTSITPMAGTAGYLGSMNRQVYNQYAFGLGLDFPVAPMISTEVEGGFAQYTTNYALLRPPTVSPFLPPVGAPHMFNQYNLGVNGKVYIIRNRVFRPYIGGGLMALYYENMERPQALPPFRYYNTVVGAGQLLLGADVSVTQDIGLGVRGAWVVPVINQPLVQSTPYGTAAPGYEDASIINSSFYKVMGTIRVNL